MTERKPRRKIDLAEGRAALEAWAQDPEGATRPVLATAVRFTLEELTAIAPTGKSVEVRVPPFGVTQCIPGPVHTRGTPPNVIETDPDTWLHLVVGRLSWDEATESGTLTHSGSRADLTAWLPLFPGLRHAPAGQ